MNTNKIKDKIAKGNLSDGIEDLIQLLKDFNDKQMLNDPSSEFNAITLGTLSIVSEYESQKIKGEKSKKKQKTFFSL